VRTLAGHGRIVGLVAVSSGGLQVASAARDRTVRVWRLADGSARVFTGHWGYLTALGFKPDGRSLVSVDQRGRVCTWDLRTSGDLSVPD
jgi:WD40 repeat protein